MFNFGSRAARKSPVATSETAMSAEVTTAAAAPPASGHNSGAHTDTRELVELLEADLKRAGKRMEETGGVTKRRDRKSTRLNSSHIPLSRMPSSA